MTGKTITFISDTHGLHDALNIEPTTVLCHSGDYSNSGTVEDARKFLEWFNKQPAEHKVFISGNHDGFAYRNREEFKSLVDQYSNVYYLEDSDITLEGLKIYGSPWTPRFFDWFFMKSQEELKEHWEWDSIPKDTDILLTHGPCFGIGDRTATDVITGDLSLLNSVKGLDRLLVHSFGHIHEGASPKGSYYSTGVVPGTMFINSSVVNIKYRVVHEPRVLQLDALEAVYTKQKNLKHREANY